MSVATYGRRMRSAKLKCSFCSAWPECSAHYCGPFLDARWTYRGLRVVQNGRTYRNAVYWSHSCGPRQPCIKRGSRSSTARGNFMGEGWFHLGSNAAECRGGCRYESVCVCVWRLCGLCQITLDSRLHTLHSSRVVSCGCYDYR